MQYMRSMYEPGDIARKVTSLERAVEPLAPIYTLSYLPLDRMHKKVNGARWNDRLKCMSHSFAGTCNYIVAVVNVAADDDVGFEH